MKIAKSMTKLNIKLNRKTCRVEIMPQPASEHNRKSAPVSAYKMRDERRRMETFLGMGNACNAQTQALKNLFMGVIK